MKRIMLRKDCKFWMATLDGVTIPTIYGADETFNDVACAIMSHNHEHTVELTDGSNVVARIKGAGAIRRATDSEVATILAGLRLFQEGRENDEGVENMEHFDATPALSDEDIDALCEDINSGTVRL